MKKITTMSFAGALTLALALVACNREAKNQGSEGDTADSTEASQENQPVFAEDKPLPGKPPTARNRERLALILNRRSIDDVGQVREEGLVAATLLSDGTGFQEIADLSQAPPMNDVVLMKDLEHVVYISPYRTSVNTGQEERMLIQRHLKTGVEKEWIFGESFDSYIENLRHHPDAAEKYRLMFKNSKTYPYSGEKRARVIQIEYHPYTNTLLALNYKQAVYIDFNTGKRKIYFHPWSNCTRIGLNRSHSHVYHAVDSTRAQLFNFIQTIGDNRFTVVDTSKGRIDDAATSVSADFNRIIIGRRIGDYGYKPEWGMPVSNQMALIDSNLNLVRALPFVRMWLSGDGEDLYFWVNGIGIHRKAGGAIWRVHLNDLPERADKLTIKELAPLGEKIFDLSNYSLVNLQIHPLES